MKVCFVSPYAYPLFARSDAVVHGGAEVQIYNISRYLARAGAEVTVIVADFGQPATEVHDGVRLLRSHAVGRHPALRDRVQFKAKLLASLARSACNVVVTSCAGSDVGVIAGFCKLSRKRFIYRTAQEIECDGEYERASGIAGRLFGSGLKIADAIVTQSEQHRTLLSQRGLRSVVIRNAFEVGKPVNAELRSLDGLWVGRCDSLKRPELFLDLVQSLPNRTFAMICPRHPLQPELFAEVRARAGSLPNLRFVESVPYHQSQSWYEQARVLIGTSESEGFPNTYVQACLAGTPIVSLKVDPAGFITKYGAGIVGDGSIGSARNAVERLLREKAVWFAASRSASDYARANHDLELEGAKWIQLLKEMNCTSTRQLR